jgi:tetratricopeptide (TPR) repeat protein
VAADPLLVRYEDSFRKRDLTGALQASEDLLKGSRTAENLVRHARLLRLLNHFPECGKVLDELAKIDEGAAEKERAEWLVERGLYDAALKVADAIATRDARDLTPFRVRARVYRIRRRIDDASAAVEAGLKLAPDDRQLSIEHAALLANRDNPKRDEDAAWVKLNAILDVDPFDNIALATLSGFQRRDGEVDARFAEMETNAPGDFLVLTHRGGFELYTRRRESIALTSLKAALRSNPRSQAAWLRMMDALERLGENIAPTIEEAMKAVPGAARVQQMRLNDLRDRGKLAEADALLAQLIAEDPDNLDLIEARIDLRRRQGRVIEARVLAAEAEGRAQSGSLRRMIATTYFETRQYESARRVLWSGPTTTQVWSDRILCEINEGTYARGLEVAEQAEEEFPRAPSILALKAWLLAHAGRFADAKETLDRAREAEPGSDYPDIVDAEIQLLRCNFKPASTIAELMLKKYPNRIDLRYTLCEVALHTGKPADAIRIADEILALDASRTTAIQMKAMALERSARPDEAVELLDDAVERFSYSGGLRACRGHMRLQEGDIHGAREDFEHAIDKSPEAAVVAKTGLATIAYRARQLGEARYWFKRAADAQPSSADALANLAWAYAVGSTPAEWNAAEKYSAEARKYVRNHEPALAVLGVVAYKRGERRKALRLMTAASAGAPEKYDIAVNLATMQRLSGKIPEAEATARKVLEADPGHTRARVELAAVLLKRRKPEDARAMAEAAVDENPSIAAGWRILAATHLASGDSAGAEAVLRRAMMECDESELLEIRVDLSRILLTSSTPSTRDARLQEAREHLSTVLGSVEDHPEALVLRAWSDLKLERPAMALRALGRVRGGRLSGYALSLRQAAIEQRIARGSNASPMLQYVLAALVVLQLGVLWGIGFYKPSFIETAQFATFVSLLSALLLIVILLPRLANFKFGNVVEAALNTPPAAATVDAIVIPLSEFELQPSLTPVIGVFAYDT